MTHVAYPASTKQLSFLRDLLDTRQVPDAARISLEALIDSGELVSKTASEFIDQLLKLPRAVSPSSPLQLALAEIPKAMYAIHVDYIDVTTIGHTVNGDYLFVEVKEYMNTLYMRRLHGNVGGFTRTKMEPADVLDIVKTIKADPYEFTRKFGEIYTVCGKCGAELTDPVSRSLYLGPTCRKAFGR